MYKLIAIELDGTLLNSYGEISKENGNAIKCAISKGAKVVLTSGRTNTAIDNFADTKDIKHSKKHPLCLVCEGPLLTAKFV